MLTHAFRDISVYTLCDSPLETQVWIEIHQNYWSMICGDLNMYSVRWEIPKFCSWFQLRKSKIVGATRVDLRCDRQLPPTHHQATECRIGPRRMSVRVPTWSGKPNCASDIHTRAQRQSANGCHNLRKKRELLSLAKKNRTFQERHETTYRRKFLGN